MPIHPTLNVPVFPVCSMAHEESSRRSLSSLRATWIVTFHCQGCLSALVHFPSSFLRSPSSVVSLATLGSSDEAHPACMRSTSTPASDAIRIIIASHQLKPNDPALQPGGRRDVISRIAVM